VRMNITIYAMRGPAGNAICSSSRPSPNQFHSERLEVVAVPPTLESNSGDKSTLG
jgi:hypothetical protein